MNQVSVTRDHCCLFHRTVTASETEGRLVRAGRLGRPKSAWGWGGKVSTAVSRPVFGPENLLGPRIGGK